MAPRRRSALGALAAALWLLCGLGAAQAACVTPGNLTQDGIDCLVFDPATSTTVVTELKDANLAINEGGASFFQVGFRSQPSGSYPVDDIGFREKNVSTYALFSTNDILSAFSPAYSYTSVDAGFSTNPMYVQFTIPGGYAVPAGASFQLILLTNTDGATGPDGQLVFGIGNAYAAIPRDFYSIPITQSPTGTPSAAPTGSPTRAPTGRPTRAPTIAPTAAPTYMPVSPDTCYELCRDYYRPLGIDYFYFQIYNNRTHEICGCCEDCDTTTPGPRSSEVFQVIEPTDFPTPTPTRLPTLLPTLAPTNNCPPVRTKAKPIKKEVEQGKKLGVYVKLKLRKQKDQDAKHEREKPVLGLLVTLSPNTTLARHFTEGAAGGLKRKGLKDFRRIDEATLAWQPIKRGSRRKVSLLLGIRVDPAFPDPFLTVGLAGFTGDLCVGGRTEVTVPVVPAKRTSSSKAPKRSQLAAH